MPGPDRRHGSRLAALILAVPLLMVGVSSASAEDSTGAETLPEVVVVGVLPGSTVPLNEVSANVQRLDSAAVSRGRAGDLADALNRGGGGIGINDTQGNPYQSDVNFRGFTASPILGTPQGLSVFVDGVRVNEAFGDAVNWDLIPPIAIEQVTLIPGSDPVFGLNTLGGALAVTTKRGFTTSGTTAELTGGSFRRRALEVESGGHSERLDYYVAGNLLDDDGWADHNPSRLRQAIGKVGYRDDVNDITLSLQSADNSLEGNQTLPLSFLGDPAQAYTWPDTQTDRMTFANLSAIHRMGQHWSGSATVYYREVETDVVNSNVNNDYDPTSPVAPGNQPTGNAIEHIAQYRPGIALELTSQGDLLEHRNTLVFGASYDRGITSFTQYNQEAGISRDTSSSQPTAVATSVRAVNDYSGLYATDTLGISDTLFITFAGRYNHARVTLEDRIGTALNGRHSFDRINPYGGITWNPARGLTLFASYGEGMRVPTPVELTCADPNAPCSLPNAFSADPALKAVESRTFEIGARGTIRPGIRLSGSAFRTTLENDIEFVSSGGGAVSAGYFENVGHTRRQGVEVSLEAASGPLSATLRYTYLEATFESPFIINSPDNSSAAPLSCPTCTDILVRPGNRIPGIPKGTAKLRLEYAPGLWSAGLNLVGQSAQYARGDENNQDVNGPVPGFLVANLDARWSFSRRWQLAARLDNALDRRYSSFALLGQNVFTAPGGTFDTSGSTWRDEQFRSVGAPRSLWVTVQARLGSQ